MIELAAQLEASPLAEALRRSRWVYPLVNAGHILGLALLVGAILPFDLRVIAGREAPGFLRVWAASGLALAVCCGALLFAAQASDYVANDWFLFKMTLLAAAAVNASIHLRWPELAPWRRRTAAAMSLALWPTILVSGRMIAYS